MHIDWSSFALTIVGLRRRSKRLILATADFILVFSLLWLLITARYWTPFIPPSATTLLLMIAAPLCVVGMLLFWHGYHEVTRFIGPKGSTRLAAIVLAGLAVWVGIVLMIGQNGLPRSAIALFIATAPVAVVGLRSVAAGFLRWAGVAIPNRSREKEKIPAVIYGAGKRGVELSQSPMFRRTRSIVAFVDPSPGVAGRTIEGIRVLHPERLTRPSFRGQFDEVVVALDADTLSERHNVLRTLEPLNARVRILPGVTEFNGNHEQPWDLRGVEARDLLGRSVVPPDEQLTASIIRNNVIMVTGAGGTIGSEISRQVARLQPAGLVLVDHSEAALFSIEQDVLSAIDKTAWPQPFVIAALTSVANANAIRDLLIKHGVHSIFHAAAFKHVPMLERHPVAAVSNNIMATASLAKIAIECRVKKFVLISTDKAVRPTNVMGASKRVAELVLQDLVGRQSGTVFSCVRFGNVFGSSGSVVERFADQIRNGRPVTVTHPDMERYFMSVGEAAGLVLQSAAMSQGGETFLLDMGEPIKVVQLARSMIRFMGYEERTEENPFGEIEIVYTGLRPGEKLTEELLVDMKSAVGTIHPRIMTSIEPHVDPALLELELTNLARAVELRDVGLIIASLTVLVSDYHPSKSIIAQANQPAREIRH